IVKSFDYRKHSVRPTDELKLLQDSFDAIFHSFLLGDDVVSRRGNSTESGVNSDDSVHLHNDSGCEKVEPPAEKVPRRKKSSTECSMMKGCSAQRINLVIQKPLTVDVETKAECAGSCSSTRSVTSDPISFSKNVREVGGFALTVLQYVIRKKTHHTKG
ncbi:hypothetical protein OSTOST_14634, partial [Ostertagia ostertagi]